MGFVILQVTELLLRSH